MSSWSRPQQVKLIGKKLIVYNITVKWRDEEVKEAIRARRKAHARYTSSKTTTGWEEYATPGSY